MLSGKESDIELEAFGANQRRSRRFWCIVVQAEELELVKGPRLSRLQGKLRRSLDAVINAGNNAEDKLRPDYLH